jgi:hypothetical protein
MARKAKFTAELFEGHGGVHAVLVPFDPEAVWDVTAVPLDDRREGWLVKGTVNGAPFHGWIGYRWKRHFVILDAALRRAAKAKVGDTVSVVIEPTTSPRALAIALEQAKLTTAPSRRRRDRA